MTNTAKKLDTQPTWKNCGMCGGSGKVPTLIKSPYFGGFTAAYVVCQQCNNTRDEQLAVITDMEPAPYDLDKQREMGRAD